MSEISKKPDSVSEIELAIIFERSVRTLLVWRHEGIAPKHYFVGRQVRYLLTDIEEFKKNHSKRIKLSTDVVSEEQP